MSSNPKKGSKKRSALNQARSNTVVLRGRKIETMHIEGTQYFPCRICKRLFKEEKLAIEHLQKCRPRIYLLSTENQSNKVTRDPYEIIPEEMDLEDGIINNNSADPSPCSPGNGRKKYRRCNNNRKEIDDEKNSISEPKTNINSNIQEKVMSKNDVSSVEVTVLKEKMKKDDNIKIKEKSTPKKSKSILNREKQRADNKKLKEQQIQERLRRISERLRKSKRIEPDEDDEDAQRRAIEERLSSLNKESEMRFFETDDELGSRLKDEENVDGNNQREDLMSNRIAVGIANHVKNGLGEGNLACIKEITSNTEEASSEIIVITQKPDGQLHGCRKCSEVFISAVDLLRHTRAKHTYPRIIMAPTEVEKLMKLTNRSCCPICKKPFPSSNKSAYMKHLQTHSSVAKHECPVCKKKFTRRDHMRAHEKRHII